MFFRPLNLITGIYGMNLEFMPELKWHYGYLLSLCIMPTITVSIMVYFKSKGVLDANGGVNEFSKLI
jgi:magnesium transporter